VTGVPEGQIAVYPDTIPAVAPSYQPAFTIGAFESRLLGKTDSGVDVSVWWLPGFEVDALAGTQDLVEFMNFYTSTFGPYIFGNKAGSVLVDWNATDGTEYGGMEQHPLWHVEQESGFNPIYHAHEAAHGWAGDGLRLAYVEDFCLISEGLATALSVWAMGAVNGPEAEAYYWDLYEDWASYSATEETSILVWPAGQDVHDMYNDLWGLKAYAYGALYYRLLRDEIMSMTGQDQLFSTLNNFYADRLGTAVSSDELLLFIEDRTGYPAYDLAIEMVRNEGIVEYYGLTAKTEPPTLAVPGSTRAVERVNGL
jgi:aminopeptidase N